MVRASLAVRMAAAPAVAFVAAVALGPACSRGAGPAASASTLDAGGAGDATADDGGVEAGPLEVPRGPSALALSDILGISSHPQLGTDADAVAERAFEWSKLAELGVHRMRTDFTWADIEPQKGTFVWTSYDALVAEASAHGVELLAVLDYGVAWATADAGTDTHYPPDHAADFGAFAAAVATRYGGALEYEVWNEPNNGLSFWEPTLNGDPAAYGALLLEANKDVLAAQPGAKVAYAGTVYDDLVKGPDFVAQSFTDTPGLAAALNTFAMHAYMIYPPGRGPESTVGGETPLLDKIATMSGVLQTAGAAALPIWITEIGWPTMTDDPLDQQARYTVRALVLAALGGADRVFLYTLRDGPNPTAFPPEDAFGMVTWADFDSDAGPLTGDAGLPADKPVFTAVDALMGALGAYHVTKRLQAQPADAYVVQLENASAATAWIAWRATDGAPLVPVTVPASGNVRVTHVDGSTTDDAAGASGYTVQVGPDPVIVTPR